MHRSRGQNHAMAHGHAPKSALIAMLRLGRRYRIDFGTNHEGCSVERARVELDHILQQVERGTWEPLAGPRNPRQRSTATRPCT
jgi:hypothetical protein